MDDSWEIGFLFRTCKEGIATLSNLRSAQHSVTQDMRIWFKKYAMDMYKQSAKAVLSRERQSCGHGFLAHFFTSLVEPRHHTGHTSHTRQLRGKTLRSVTPHWRVLGQGPMQSSPPCAAGMDTFRKRLVIPLPQDFVQASRAIRH